MRNSLFLKVKTFPTRISLDPHDLTGEFNSTYKQEKISILYKLFQKLEQDGIYLNSLCKARNTMMPKLDYDTIRK